jgi:glycyl-tRNA synthetase
VEKAEDVYKQVKQSFRAVWDDRGNIGKRYLYQDEMGTPFCVTIDYETLEEGTVTIRNRDTAAQEKIKLAELEQYLQNVIG